MVLWVWFWVREWIRAGRGWEGLEFISNSSFPVYVLIYVLLLFSSSVVSDSATPWTAAHQASLSFSISQSLLNLMSSESMMPSNHLVLCCSCPLSFPASGSFPVRPLFASGGQSIRTSASASVLPMNIQGWFPLGLTGVIFLLSRGLSRVFSSTTIQNYQFFCTQPSLWSSSYILYD